MGALGGRAASQDLQPLVVYCADQCTRLNDLVLTHLKQSKSYTGCSMTNFRLLFFGSKQEKRPIKEWLRVIRLGDTAKKLIFKFLEDVYDL